MYARTSLSSSDDDLFAIVDGSVQDHPKLQDLDTDEIRAQVVLPIQLDLI
jgi:hypothetical protein